MGARPGAPDGGIALVAGALLVVDEADRPFLTRSLRCPDRVSAHLLGDDRVDAMLADLLADSAGGPAPPAGVGRALAVGTPLVYARERPGASGRALGLAARS